MTSCFFLIISSCKVRIHTLQDLSLITNKTTIVNYMLIIVLFSYAGLPPLAGFFSKFMVISALMDGNNYLLYAVVMVTTIISSFYYLRLIKDLTFVTKVVKKPILRNHLLLYSSPFFAYILLLIFKVEFIHVGFIKPLAYSCQIYNYRYYSPSWTNKVEPLYV